MSPLAKGGNNGRRIRRSLKMTESGSSLVRSAMRNQTSMLMASERTPHLQDPPEHPQSRGRSQDFSRGLRRDQAKKRKCQKDDKEGANEEAEEEGGRRAAVEDVGRSRHDQRKSKIETPGCRKSNSADGAVAVAVDPAANEALKTPADLENAGRKTKMTTDVTSRRPGSSCRDEVIAKSMFSSS